jgi:ApbE superfamily uncharacterized protein (UPF0280 family)
MIAADMPCWHVQHLETELFICADKRCEQIAADAVRSLRSELDAYIAVHPQFLKSLTPVEPAADASETIKAMCRAAKSADVGPMAAVAGAFSDYVGRQILKLSNQVIVENGGDIFIKTEQPKTVAVFAGNSPLSLKVGIVVDAREMPMAVCTSSGTVGPSLSFGKADAAVVVSPNAYLADACATRLGNEVKCAADIERALDTIVRISGVSGAMAIVGDVCGAVGDIRLETL